jgi:hypothetical protein
VPLREVAMIMYKADIQYNRKATRDRCIRKWLPEDSVINRASANGACTVGFTQPTGGWFTGKVAQKWQFLRGICVTF